MTRKVPDHPFSNLLSPSQSESLESSRYPLVRGEIAMWNAVLLQALQDARSDSRKSEIKKAKKEALNFLLNHNRDFYEVCDMACREPELTKAKVRQALDNNCQWRKQAGEGWRVQKRLAIEAEAAEQAKTEASLEAYFENYLKEDEAEQKN